LILTPSIASAAGGDVELPGGFFVLNEYIPAGRFIEITPSGRVARSDARAGRQHEIIPAGEL
jgi:hypothetical protein